MNPRAEGMALADLPPLTEVRKNRRIRWYRCPIEPAKLRELAEPSDSRGLFQAIGHLALWAATGLVAYYHFAQEMWWGYRAVSHDMPETRTLIGAWKEMRETWKRQQNDPDYEYDTPVPPPAVNEREDADPLAASIGGLAPRALA